MVNLLEKILIWSDNKLSTVFNQGINYDLSAGWNERLEIDNVNIKAYDPKQTGIVFDRFNFVGWRLDYVPNGLMYQINGIIIINTINNTYLININDLIPTNDQTFKILQNNDTLHGVMNFNIEGGEVIVKIKNIYEVKKTTNIRLRENEYQYNYDIKIKRTIL